MWASGWFADKVAREDQSVSVVVSFELLQSKFCVL